MNILKREGYKSSIKIGVISLLIVDYEYINDKIYYWFVIFEQLLCLIMLCVNNMGRSVEVNSLSFYQRKKNFFRIFFTFRHIRYFAKCGQNI